MADLKIHGTAIFYWDACSYGWNSEVKLRQTLLFGITGVFARQALWHVLSGPVDRRKSRGRI